MSNFDEVFERIKLATRTRTQIELAKVLNIRQSSISDAKRRNSIPADWFLKLFDRFGLNPDWIKKCSGPMYLKTEHGYTPADPERPLAAMEEPSLYDDPNAKSMVLSVFSMQSGIPSPSLKARINEFEVVGKISVPTPLAGDGIMVFKLDSTSMEPHLRKGAYVGVDKNQRRVVFGELYAVRLPYEGIGIKRVFTNIVNARAILRAENPQHTEVAIPLESLGESILGHVAWAINKY